MKTEEGSQRDQVSLGTSLEAEKGGSGREESPESCIINIYLIGGFLFL
jgi:hypothetical protein